MIYLYAYLCVGVLLLACLLVQHFWQMRKQRWVNGLLAALHREQRSLGYVLRERVLPPVIAASALIFAWPVVGLAFLWMKYVNEAEEDYDPGEYRPESFAVSRSSLISRFTVDEIETLEMVDDPLGAAPRAAFGHLNALWEKFKGEVTSGSEIWSFTEKWPQRAALGEVRSGYAELRKNSVGVFFVKSIRLARFPR